VRPADEIIVQSTELSGSPAFEEIVNLEDVVGLSDPLREALTEAVSSPDPSLLEA